MDRPPLTIEAAGMLSRAKRRQDYARIWMDLDTAQWYTPEGDWSPGIQVERFGALKFAAADNSIFPVESWQTLDYHLHGGLSTEQDIYGLAFEWSSLGTMELEVFETDLPDDTAVWAPLGTYGGSTNASADSVTLTCSAAMRGLRITVGWTGTKTLSGGDEWLKIGNLRVLGQSGSASIGTALTDILVDTGLAGSYSSGSVG
jgi:hypothetical protein